MASNVSFFLFFFLFFFSVDWLFGLSAFSFSTATADGIWKAAAFADPALLFYQAERPMTFFSKQETNPGERFSLFLCGHGNILFLVFLMKHLYCDPRNLVGFFVDPRPPPKPGSVANIGNHSPGFGTGQP